MHMESKAWETLHTQQRVHQLRNQVSLQVLLFAVLLVLWSDPSGFPVVAEDCPLDLLFLWNGSTSLAPIIYIFLKSCFENNMQYIVQLSATFVCALGLIYLFFFFFASPLVTGLHAVPMGGILCWTSGSNCCDEGARAVHGQVGLRVPVLGW